MPKVKIKSEPHPAVLPTYQELAATLAAVVVRYVSNVDRPNGHRFIGYTGLGPEMQRAIDAREALIEHRVVERKGREE
jgi:hypothetical protein